MTSETVKGHYIGKNCPFWKNSEWHFSKEPIHYCNSTWPSPSIWNLLSGYSFLIWEKYIIEPSVFFSCSVSNFHLNPPCQKLAYEPPPGKKLCQFKEKFWPIFSAIEKTLRQLFEPKFFSKTFIFYTFLSSNFQKKQKFSKNGDYAAVLSFLATETCLLGHYWLHATRPPRQISISDPPPGKKNENRNRGSNATIIPSASIKVNSLW